VGAAEGCDLLIFFKSKIKRSQPSAAPAQKGVMQVYCANFATRFSQRGV
jgi:hypothetical protein